MSIETLLVGAVIMKKGVSYEETVKFVKNMSNYTEVYKIFREGNIITSDKYIKMMDDIPWNEKAVVVKTIINDTFQFDVYIRDLSFSSHIYKEKFEQLTEFLKTNENILSSADFSLYDLSKPTDCLVYRESKERRIL